VASPGCHAKLQEPGDAPGWQKWPHLHAHKHMRAVLSPCFTLASPRCCLQVLACACVDRAMPRPDVGEALRLGQWGRACQLTCRLLGEGRLDPAEACHACFHLFASGRPLYDIYLKQFGGRPLNRSCKPLQARWQGQAGRQCLCTGQFATVSLSWPCFCNFNDLAEPYRHRTVKTVISL